MKTKHKFIGAFLIGALTLSSCGDGFFDIENAGVATKEEIDELANSNPDALIKVVEPMLSGIQNYMVQYNTENSASEIHNDFGLMSIYHLADVMNDDLAFEVAGSGWFTFDYQMIYWGEQYIRPYMYWNFFYTIINQSNEIIDKIVSSKTENEELMAIMGQAFALRGFSLFYLCQMFQQTYVGNEQAPGVPIILSTSEGESKTNRVPLEEDYKQIVADFTKSLELLDGWQRKNKIQIDKQVAAGLYSRVCLVMNKWADAATYARMARQGYSIFTPEELLKEGENSAFNNIGQKEWMWGFDITPETSTTLASFFSFICSYDGGYGGEGGDYRKIDAKLYNSMSPTDARRRLFKYQNSADYTPTEQAFPDYTNLKFKKVSNWQADYVFMRTSEMVLTEAEALARSGQGTQAAIVLKELMQNRDPKWNRTTVSGDEVYQQRRLELWGEGFSLFDHLRLKKGIDRNYEGTNHLASDRYTIDAGSWYFLYQIPLKEIDNNDKISEADQNPAPTENKFKN